MQFNVQRQPADPPGAVLGLLQPGMEPQQDGMATDRCVCTHHLEEVAKRPETQGLSRVLPGRKLWYLQKYTRFHTNEEHCGEQGDRNSRPRS